MFSSGVNFLKDKDSHNVCGVKSNSFFDFFEVYNQKMDDDDDEKIELSDDVIKKIKKDYDCSIKLIRAISECHTNDD